MKEWWEGDNVEQILNEGVEDKAEDVTISNDYITPANSQASSSLCYINYIYRSVNWRLK